MRQLDAMAVQRPRSLWSWFPWFIAAALGAVIAVNSYMVYAALSTFPGNAGSDGFDLSNHYNTIIARMKQQALLGWTLQAQVDAEGHPVVVLLDRTGVALADAEITATAQRPLGDRHSRPEHFSEVSPGHYLGDAALDEQGQWDLELWATAGAKEFTTTRRVVRQ